MSETAKSTEQAHDLGLDLGEAAPEGAGYRVLARKYRPASFRDLIGQDAMVRTISNAFESGRIRQAWLLTGVRGVGKTTTARILARALNYQLPDGSVTAPTVRMPVLGVHCPAIMESRHVDVLELDAASHNSVDDIRQINDAIRYSPVSARYKVYILDEVHMLSTAAFNALLKTLEEPPPHAKFVLATTEVHKIPATVLSRCQRHEFRRIPAAEIAGYLEERCRAESLPADAEALALIARAATGSMRDAESLLDQLASTGEPVTLARTQDVLGTAAGESVSVILEAIAGGDAGQGMGAIQRSLDGGSDARQLARQVVDYLRGVLLHQMGQPDLVDAPAEVRAEMTRLARVVPLTTILAGLRSFGRAAGMGRPYLS